MAASRARVTGRLAGDGRVVDFSIHEQVSRDLSAPPCDASSRVAAASRGAARQASCQTSAGRPG